MPGQNRQMCNIFMHVHSSCCCLLLLLLLLFLRLQWVELLYAYGMARALSHYCEAQSIYLCNKNMVVNQIVHAHVFCNSIYYYSKFAISLISLKYPIKTNKMKGNISRVYSITQDKIIYLLIHISTRLWRYPQTHFILPYSEHIILSAPPDDAGSRRGTIPHLVAGWWAHAVLTHTIMWWRSLPNSEILWCTVRSLI